jgi:hypothetical protein
MKTADKKIIFRELKLIREKSDLMIFAMQKDKDFPLLRDLDEVDAIVNSSTLLRSKIKELIISKPYNYKQ